MKKIISIKLLLLSLITAKISNAQWTTLTTNNTTKLNSIYCLDAKTCYAVGNTGTVLKTGDGGDTWIKQPFPNTEILNTVIFPDANRGIILNSSNKIYKSDDANGPWKYDFTFTGGTFFALNFPTNNIGYLTTEWFGADKVFETNCQGINPADSWVAGGATNISGDTKASYFTDYKTGFIASNAGEIFQTTDGNQTWDTSYYNANFSFKSIHFVGKDTGYCLAGNLNADSSYVLKTTDAGATWNIISNFSYAFARPTTLFFPTSQVGYMGGLNGVINTKGKILKTVDGGLTWLENDSTTTAINSIYFPTPNVGYAVTKDGNILKLGTDTVADCALPTTLSVRALSTTAATLEWNPVDGAVSYNVRYKPTSSATWLTTTSNTNSVAVNSLTSNVDYEFQVETVCSVNSGYTLSYIFTTNNCNCSVPSGLGISYKNDSTVILNWTDNGSGGYGFKIRHKPMNSSVWTNSSCDYLTLSDTITGLDSSTVYEFQVERVCTACNSGFSGIATYTTSGTGTGINERENGVSQLEIFPNPNNGIFKLKYKVHQNQHVRIEIIDVLGNQVYLSQMYKNKGQYTDEINTSVAKGFYFIQLKQDNADLMVQQFVVD